MVQFVKEAQPRKTEKASQCPRRWPCLSLHAQEGVWKDTADISPLSSWGLCRAGPLGCGVRPGAWLLSEQVREPALKNTLLPHGFPFLLPWTLPRAPTKCFPPWQRGSHVDCDEEGHRAENAAAAGDPSPADVLHRLGHLRGCHQGDSSAVAPLLPTLMTVSPFIIQEAPSPSKLELIVKQLCYSQKETDGRRERGKMTIAT